MEISRITGNSCNPSTRHHGHTAHLGFCFLLLPGIPEPARIHTEHLLRFQSIPFILVDPAWHSHGAKPRRDGHRMGLATVEAIPISRPEFQHRHAQTLPGDIEQKTGSSSQVPKSQIFRDSQDLICSSAAKVGRARSHRHLLRLRLPRSLGSAKFWELCVPPWPFCWHSTLGMSCSHPPASLGCVQGWDCGIRIKGSARIHGISVGMGRKMGMERGHGSWDELG